ncbi:MAG: alpha-L-arabinofuranosidase [Clostridiales bacterium]|nr:alpha-L-arabinofuranosidase [Clostridiales bacterium]
MYQLDKIAGNLIAWYPFNDAAAPGKDASGHGMDARIRGYQPPVIRNVHGRMAASFTGGGNGNSYFELPWTLLDGVNDSTGFSVSIWFSSGNMNSVWERLFDFGNGMGGPYVFLTRNLRGVCYRKEDIASNAVQAPTDVDWHHVVMTVSGTNGGTASSAGPRVYMDGRLVADGWISQTSSGLYKKYQQWWETFDKPGLYRENYIGRSQYPADPDYHGSMTDFRIYDKVLDEEEILALMCEQLDTDHILELAKERYLNGPMKIVNTDIDLPHSLMEGQVNVFWRSSRPDVITAEGRIRQKTEPTGVLLTALLTCGSSWTEKKFPVTVVPDDMIPCELTVHGKRELLDVSPVLYGLFYEDINHAADGGLYAEMIQNRSFEDFHYDVYDARSGENGISSGRVRTPLRYWFGDINACWVHTDGGLRDYFDLDDQQANACYIEIRRDCKLYNHGFCDDRFLCSMNIREGEKYYFSIWAKSRKGATMETVLMTDPGERISNVLTFEFEAGGDWKKYEGVFVGTKTAMGKIELAFTGRVSIDMVSMMPEWVWGANEEETSPTAHANYLRNPNYRLRRDMVEALKEMHPSFLRFPGGCISEGSYIWDNVYDWKDSVGPVETRKENYNVWGYTMTLGLGYMEYFQLAEDLGAAPLPVMACGVLCQARSDYANPAGGRLQEKYINNFTDLIDFAISTNFAENKWAALRRDMGHEAPFDLHYLGVGNENWGTEFFASFQDFKYAIDCHMQKYYPNYELHIISTAGAQADDRAYQKGWRFLAGYQTGRKRIRFTDGWSTFERDISWYEHQKNYMETIVDEHYYRSNDYLLENVDRYNYYYRPYKNGVLDEEQTSKVFVGEYASSDKNTLAGAIAEAAVMTGFERNSDVVRLAATAPLFNKVSSDSNYHWTPDAIWFDNRKLWRTPTYYVQQLFAQYVGKKVLGTTYELYDFGKKEVLTPHGGITIRATGGRARFIRLTVSSKTTGGVLFEQDFDKPMSVELKKMPLDDGSEAYYINQPEWKEYKVELVVEKMDPNTEIALGAGLCIEALDEETLQHTSQVEYCVGKPNRGTGLRVIKNGREGYKMGDYACGEFAGNLRACFDEPVKTGTYKLTVDYGDTEPHLLRCFYEGAFGSRKAIIEAKLEYYVRDLYHSVTSDDNHVYIKLVNAENYGKTCVLKLEDIAVAAEAKVITLTGSSNIAHVPNVNTAYQEVVQPVEESLAVNGDELVVSVPDNALAVVVLDRA